MTISLIRGRWAVLGAALLLSLVLAGCGVTTPVSSPDSPSEPKAEAEKPDTGDITETSKLSAENPVVVLPTSEDLERRKKLAELLPTASDSKVEPKPATNTESSGLVAQTDKSSAGAPTPTDMQGAQKEEASANPEIQRSADPTETPIQRAPPLLSRSNLHQGGGSAVLSATKARRSGESWPGSTRSPCPLPSYGERWSSWILDLYLHQLHPNHALSEAVVL